jgi:ribosomal protein S6E (S10)
MDLRHTVSYYGHVMPGNNTINMTKTIFFICALAFAVSARSQQKIINDANASTRDLKDFHAIEIGDGIDLYVSQSNNETVAVSASKPEYREKISTVVEDGVLKIYYGPKTDWHFTWNNRSKKLKAYVSFKSIDRLSGSGGSDVSVNGTIVVPKLRLTVSGGSDFDGAVNVDDLSIDQSGGSDVRISGKAANLKIELSGGSDFKGFDLASDYCNASGSGGADMQVRVNKELTVNTSGGSDVYYKGSAVIKEARTSGGGSVSKRD